MRIFFWPIYRPFASARVLRAKMPVAKSVIDLDKDLADLEDPTARLPTPVPAQSTTSEQQQQEMVQEASANTLPAAPSTQQPEGNRGVQQQQQPSHPPAAHVQQPANYQANGNGQPLPSQQPVQYAHPNNGQLQHVQLPNTVASSQQVMINGQQTHLQHPGAVVHPPAANFIVVTTDGGGGDGVGMTCPSCTSKINPVVVTKRSRSSWVFCVIIFLLGFIFPLLWCGCCFIPLCVAKDKHRACPQCRQDLGKV